MAFVEAEAELQFRNWSSLRADLTWIYEGAIPESYRNARVRDRILGAWLIQKGTVRLEQEGNVVTAGAGEWVVVKQAEGQQTFSENAKIISVRFIAEWPDGKPFYETGLSTVLKAADFPDLEKSVRRILTAVKPLAPPAPTDLRVHGISLHNFIEVKARFWEWFSVLHDALASRDIYPTRTSILDERIQTILQALDQLPLSARLREDDLARQAGLSTAHFVRLFRSEVGTTPKRYFDDRRREACRRLLGFSETPIKEIAISLGFLRLSDFSAWFKDGHQVSPRKYREQEQQKGKVPV